MKKTFLTVCIVSAFIVAAMGSAYAAETLSLLTWKGYAPKNLVEKFEGKAFEEVCLAHGTQGEGLGLRPQEVHYRRS